MTEIRTKEGYGFPTVHQTMIIGEGHNHYRANDNLAVNYYGFVLDGMHA